jgi:hypothetical protein
MANVRKISAFKHAAKSVKKTFELHISTLGSIQLASVLKLDPVPTSM